MQKPNAKEMPHSGSAGGSGQWVPERGIAFDKAVYGNQRLLGVSAARVSIFEWVFNPASRPFAGRREYARDLRGEGKEADFGSSNLGCLVRWPATR